MGFIAQYWWIAVLWASGIFGSLFNLVLGGGA